MVKFSPMQSSSQKGDFRRNCLVHFFRLLAHCIDSDAQFALEAAFIIFHDIFGIDEHDLHHREIPKTLGTFAQTKQIEIFFLFFEFDALVTDSSHGFSQNFYEIFAKFTKIS